MLFIRWGLAVLEFLVKIFRKPRSKIRIEQLTDDALSIDANTRPDWVQLRWDLTAINDGRRDGQLASPVFEDATFSTQDRQEMVTPDDIGKGSVGIEFREKTESKVSRLSNDKIRIVHDLSKHEGIHEYITDFDTMTFRYSVMVEDGSIPYLIEAEATEDVSGIRFRWSPDRAP